MTAPGGEAAALDALPTRELPPGRDHPGRGTAGQQPRGVFGGGPAGRRHRRPARLDPATGRRAGRAGGRLRCPNLLPGGRPVADAAARAQAAARLERRRPAAATGPRHRRRSWPPRATGELGALLIGGVELADLPDPAAALAAIDAAPFVVSLELRESAVTELADVVFPVAPVVEKAGAFLNWEGRIRPFEAGAAHQCHLRRTGAADPGRRAGRRPRPADAWQPCGRRARRWDGRGAGAPDVSPARARSAGHRRSGAGELADAAGRRAATGRRTPSGRHRAAAGGATVGGHRRRNRRRPTGW